MRLVTVMALLVGVTVGLAAAPSAQAQGRYKCWVSHGHRHCVLAREYHHVWRAKSVQRHPVPHWRYARAQLHYGLYVEPNIYGKRLSEHELHLVRAITFRPHCWLPGRQACGTGAAMWNAVMGFGGTATPHPFGWAPN